MPPEKYMNIIKLFFLKNGPGNLNPSPGRSDAAVGCAIKRICQKRALQEIMCVCCNGEAVLGNKRLCFEREAACLAKEKMCFRTIAHIFVRKHMVFKQLLTFSYETYVFQTITIIFKWKHTVFEQLLRSSNENILFPNNYWHLRMKTCGFQAMTDIF